MPPNLIEAGLKINTEEYLTILFSVFLTRIHENCNPNKIILVHDPAPAHAAKEAQTYLKENVYQALCLKTFGLVVHQFWMYVTFGLSA